MDKEHNLSCLVKAKQKNIKVTYNWPQEKHCASCKHHGISSDIDKKKQSMEKQTKLFFYAK